MIMTMLRLIQMILISIFILISAYVLMLLFAGAASAFGVAVLGLTVNQARWFASIITGITVYLVVAYCFGSDEESKKSPDDGSPPSPPPSNSSASVKQPKTNVSLNKLLRFFTGDPERVKARHELNEVIEGMYDDEIRYLEDMLEVSCLRESYIHDQKSLNIQLGKIKDRLILILESKLGGRLPVRFVNASSAPNQSKSSLKTRSLEDAKMKLNLLQDEWIKYKSPDEAYIRCLTASEIKKQLWNCMMIKWFVMISTCKR